MDIADKVVVVTGASSGIGRRLSLDLASGGAVVCVTARRDELLRDLVEEMGGEGRGHSWTRTDVSSKDQVRRLGDHVRSTYGRCDILVNNAGFSNERPLYREGGLDDLEAVMATNFFGAVYCTAELLPLLLESAPSHVVNVASVAGRLAVPGVPAYTASKFALVGWSEALHHQLKPRGIHVASIEPGLIPTEGFPHEGAARSRLLRLALGSDRAVSRAILDAIAGRKMQRVTPRWYYLLQIPRLLTPKLYGRVHRKPRSSGRPKP